RPGRSRTPVEQETARPTLHAPFRGPVRLSFSAPDVGFSKAARHTLPARPTGQAPSPRDPTPATKRGAGRSSVKAAGSGTVGGPWLGGPQETVAGRRPVRPPR